MIIIKKYFKYLGLIGICLLSFYYTEKVALYVKSNNPIMTSLKEVEKSKYIEAINSTIIDNIFIIPGLNGKSLDIDASFYNMNDKYDETKLVFKETIPTISIKDNKDKIIIKGNKEKNSVSILLENTSNLSNYLTSKNIKVSILNNLDKDICYTNDNNIPKYCSNKYVFTHTKEINHSNISSKLNKISSGDIILVKNTLSLEELNLIINVISYKDLSIVPICSLIKEDNN